MVQITPNVQKLRSSCYWTQAGSLLPDASDNELIGPENKTRCMWNCHALLPYAHDNCSEIPLIHFLSAFEAHTSSTSVLQTLVPGTHNLLFSSIGSSLPFWRWVKSKCSDSKSDRAVALFNGIVPQLRLISYSAPRLRWVHLVDNQALSPSSLSWGQCESHLMFLKFDYHRRCSQSLTVQMFLTPPPTLNIWSPTLRLSTPTLSANLAFPMLKLVKNNKNSVIKRSKLTFSEFEVEQ